MSRDARQNRLQALATMRDARRPVKIHHSTGRALAMEGLATKGAKGFWAITERGISYIDSEEREERRGVIDRRLTHEQHEYIRRVLDWLDVHADLTPLARLFARHVAGALLLGVVPVESGHEGWGEGPDEKIRAWVEAAIDGLEAMREAKKAARASKGDLVITYGVGKRIEARAVERRRAAVEAAVVEQEEDANIVSLDGFRQKRLA